MVMRAPVALPPISAGAPAIVASMTAKYSTGSGSITLYATAYAVNSPTVNGFYAYFYPRGPGDPRGDVNRVMGTFDPHYTG
jgi:hypothetical protein